MDAARKAVLEAATEIERLHIVIDCYAAYAAASEREHRRERARACRCGAGQAAGPSLESEEASRSAAEGDMT